LTDAQILAGGYDVSGVTNQVALEYGAEALDDTHFGDTTRIAKGGLKTVELSLSGHMEYGDTSIDKILFDNLGGPASAEPIADPLSLIAEGGQFGEVGYFFRPLLTSFPPVSGEVGELVPYEAQLVSRTGAPLIRSEVMHDTDTARTATGNGSGSQIGALATAQDSMYLALHVIAASVADTLDITVESDDNSGFTSATTRITAVQATAVSAQYLSVAGPITDDWWRIVFTIGGTAPSFTFAALLGIA